MGESDDDQESDWPEGLIVKVATSIAIANYGRSNFPKHYDAKKGSLLFIASGIISAVKRALQAGKDLDDHSVCKKVAIKINLGRVKPNTEEYWVSRAKKIISGIKRAFDCCPPNRRLKGPAQ
jgi:hypothetical protein